MVIDWPAAFDRLLDGLERLVADGDPDAAVTLDLITAQLSILQDLAAQPTYDTATLKRVRQSGRYPVWRLSHPYVEGRAVRTIVWFPDEQTVVVALFANDKRQMGDVFYDSVGSRADQIIDQWIRERKVP